MNSFLHFYVEFFELRKLIVAIEIKGKFFSENQSSCMTLRRFTGAIMNTDDDIKDRDIETLVGIVRGPGTYATPSPDRIERLLQKGLITRKKGRLRPTIKGRIIAWLYRRR